MMTLYFVTFPFGIEDAVTSEFDEFVARFLASEPRWVTVRRLSRPVSKQLLVIKKPGPRKPKEPKTEPASEAPAVEPADPFSTRGALYFEVKPLEPETDASRARNDEFDLIYQMDFSLRTGDQILLALAVFPLATSVTEMNAPLAHERAAIHRAVTRHLSAYRVWLGKRVCDTAYPHRLPGLLFGPNFLSAVTDSTVIFRVNATRRDKTFAANSQDIAAQVGDQLMEHFEQTGWRVDMVHHHVEFYMLHDHSRFAHLGLSFSAPPPPRIGNTLNPCKQLFFELLRQRIGRALFTGTLPDNSTVRGVIPRKSTLRYEMRTWKGENAMLVPLAASLVRYAGFHHGAAKAVNSQNTAETQDPLIVFDPFGGSASVLLEAWLASGRRPFWGLSGEMCAEELHCAQKNTDPVIATAHTVLNGFYGLCESNAPGVLDRLLAWRRKVEQQVESVNIFSDHEALVSQVTALGEQTFFDDMTRELVALVSGHGASPRNTFSPHFTAISADATRMPLRSAFVDCIISDMPFGRRCGTHKANTKMYPSFLEECYRVLVSPPTLNVREPVNPAPPDDPVVTGRAVPPCVPEAHEPWWHREGAVGGRAVLLTLDATAFMPALEKVRNTAPFQLATPPFQVEMAGLFPYVFVLDKVAHECRA